MDKPFQAAAIRAVDEPTPADAATGVVDESTTAAGIIEAGEATMAAGIMADEATSSGSTARLMYTAPTTTATAPATAIRPATMTDGDTGIHTRAATFLR